MKISASIYSNKEKNLEQLVRELDAHGIDMFHIDCFDASVFDDIALIRTFSKTPIDLHIIHPKPEIFFDSINTLKIEYVSIQHGVGAAIPAIPKNTQTHWGLALTMKDPLSAFIQPANDFDYVLFMASEPGVSGKPFDKTNFQRIIEFKQLFPKKQIQVDGGVDDRIAFILRLLGVNSIVSGNYLMNQKFLGVGMLNLHKTPNKAVGETDFRVADFMTSEQYLPVIEKEKLQLKGVLESIEKSALGFALVTEKQKLFGVISNADVRRSFINYLDSPGKADVAAMVNKKPVTIGANQTLTDMLHLLNNLNFIILFLPVVDIENNLKGAVLLNNLTRV